MEEDVIIIDDSGMQRNAVIVRRPGGAVDHRGGPPPPAWTRPWGGRKPYYPQPYVPAPQVPVVYQPPVTTVATTPAANTLKNWIPDIIDILAAISPLPAPPVATGDPAKDFANAMTYAGALAGSFKRADLMHSAARIIEKRL